MSFCSIHLYRTSFMDSLFSHSCRFLQFSRGISKTVEMSRPLSDVAMVGALEIFKCIMVHRLPQLTFPLTLCMMNPKTSALKGDGLEV